MVERKQVIPGDVIARGDYRYGSYIEKRGDEYIALRVGSRRGGQGRGQAEPPDGALPARQKTR